MKKRNFAFLLIAPLAVAQNVGADTVVLTSGQKLQGQVTLANPSVIHLLQDGKNTVISKSTVQSIEFSPTASALARSASESRTLAPNQLLKIGVVDVNRNAAVKDGPYFLMFSLLADAMTNGSSRIPAGTSIIAEVRASSTESNEKSKWQIVLKSAMDGDKSLSIIHGPLIFVRELPSGSQSSKGLPQGSLIDKKSKEVATKDVPYTWMREGKSIEIRVGAKQ